MFRTCLSCLFALTFLSSLHAQAEKYDPYAVVKEDPPISADGKINWPSFYKSAGTEARFQEYFKMGSCRGTNMRIVNMLKENKVDVNALPHTTLSAMVLGAQGGQIAGTDQQGKKVAILTHPQGVSTIEISGEISAAAVMPGMIVRFQGTVDSHARGVEPLTALEVISLSADLKPREVTADKLQSIVGKVERRHHELITVNVGVGKLRLLTFKLPAETRVQVTGTTFDLIAAGDLVQAEGPRYVGEGTGGAETVFAEKLIVKKAIPQVATALK